MIFVIGFISQTLFFLRTLLQWILSERAKKVISPNIYWILSIVASYLFFIYGWFRNDFAILLGQMISYYVYIWNLQKTGIWAKVHSVLKAVLLVSPAFVLVYIVKNSHYFFVNFLANKDIPLWLIILGAAGQILFSLRFVYQWLYSMSKDESLLPVGFWLISLIGSGIIILYGAFRLDPVLILGQSIGFIAYSRNIIIHKNQLKKQVN